jgi:hypothetical protein
MTSEMTMFHLRRPMKLALLLACSMSCAMSAGAAEIALEKPALTKLVNQALFNDGGRYYVQKGACHAYLENPEVKAKDGRLAIRSHLSSRLGVDAGNTCFGTAFSGWVTMSGAPLASGGSIRLQDIRIENVADASVQAMLNSILTPALPRVIEFDVLQVVKNMLRDSKEQFTANVDQLNISAVTAADDKLSVRFDFKITAK